MEGLGGTRTVATIGVGEPVLPTKGSFRKQGPEERSLIAQKAP